MHVALIGRAAPAVALIAASGSAAAAQSLTGNLFAGAGMFTCCGCGERVWRVRGGVDLPDYGRIGRRGFRPACSGR
jgi:hypothetical protein